jgi:NTP pyrophosphatase (non-canonical NTP hydrolase)
MDNDVRPEDGFIPAFNALAKFANDNAHKKGFYDKPQETGTRLMLMVSEIAEGMEADRKDLMDDKIPEFTGLEAELADCIIRILDFSHEKKLKVAEAIVRKMAFNQTRPYLHGGKKY